MSTVDGRPVGAPDATATGGAALVARGIGVSASGVELVRGVDLELGTGERVGLIGESGCGKSLTALTLMGLLPEGLDAHGSVRLAGVDDELVGAPERLLSRLRGRDLAMVFQEPMTALNPSMTAGAQVAEAITIHGDKARRRTADERAVELLDRVRLDDPAGAAAAYSHQLSGGQRQRVVLAMALANDPAVLLCDEPTTALDVTVQRQMLDLIAESVAASSMALLFITHDLAVVASICERVVVMYGGRIVEQGPVGDVFGRPRHPYTAGLLGASDLEATDAAGRLPTIAGSVPAAGLFPSGCVFRDRCPRAQPDCETEPTWSSDHGTGGGFACHHPVPVDVPGSAIGTVTGSAPDAGPGGAAGSATAPGTGRPEPGPGSASDDAGAEPLIVVDGLRRSYRRPRRSLFGPRPTVDALKGVSFEVGAGQRFGVVGESGSGKSTLVRLLAALDQPTGGSIRVEGREIGGVRERDLRWLRRDLQIVFQDPMGSLDPRMRVRDIVCEPLHAQGAADAGDRLDEMLGAVGLSTAIAHRFPHQFSGGQRQRISLARALVTRPRILLADEPVSALDVSVRAQILNLLADLADQYSLTVVFVSHDLAVVRHVCDTVAVMRGGEIVELGPTEQVYTDPSHDYTRALLAASPSLRGALTG
ncbi:MAG: ABC transporter ATP-binding protein [Actinomycetota bacterium]|nr:ABC transporter ATP-binding protein [Actinomycetota bacterium]